MDVFTTEKRRWLMRQVKTKNTSPEKLIRSALHRMGYRFRLQRKDLPGKPDIVLPRHRVVIFAHGCFWHGHDGCPRAARPTTNVEFWTKKIDRNIARDRQNVADLEAAGWRVLIVWGCQAKKSDALRTLLEGFFLPNASVVVDDTNRL